VFDKISGIKDYNAYINGNWVLLEYDPKNNIVFYVKDKKQLLTNKNNNIQVVISDKTGNTTEYNYNF
jgi:hypothetical protein